MRKLSLLLILLTLIVGATGVLSVRAQDVSLTYWDTMNDQERVVMEEIVNGCADELGYSVSYEYVPFSDAQNNYRAAAQAGNAPDVLRTEIAWGPEFAALGYLADLTDMVEQEEIDSYLAAPMNYNLWGGHVWGLPQVTDAPALLYNKALFEQAGLDPETPPASLDELKEAAIAISALGEDTFGLAQLWASYPFQAVMWGYGGGLINVTDSGELEIAINSQGTIDALNWMLGMMEDGAMDPAFDAANQYGNSMTAFKEGKRGMIFMGPWATSDVLSGEAFTDPENLGVAPIPAGPEGQGSPVGGHEYTVYAGSSFIPESLELIRCLNGVDNQVRLATELNLVPTLKAAYDDPALAENRILQGFLAQMQVATNRPVIPAGGQIYTEFDPQYQAVILGDRDPQEAMDAVAEAWQALLDQMPQMPG